MDVRSAVLRTLLRSFVATMFGGSVGHGGCGQRSERCLVWQSWERYLQVVPLFFVACKHDQMVHADPQDI